MSVKLLHKRLLIQFLLLIFFTVFIAVCICAQESMIADTGTPVKQKDVIDILKKIFKVDPNKIDSGRIQKKFQFSIIPVAGSVAGGGKAVATAFNAAFFTGNDSTTSLSTITFSPWFTFDGKIVLPARNLIWLPNDILLWKGDTRFMIYPQYTWGLGGNTQHGDKVLLEYNYIRFYHSLLKKVGSNFFFGAGYDLDYHFNISAENDSFHVDVPVFDYGNEPRENHVSSGPVINFLIDSRRNSINPAGGIYFAIDYRFNAEFLGSSSNWHSMLIDGRKYFPFDKRRQNLLAFWSYYWRVTYGKAPYLDLPSIGWDYYSRSGRGFEQNRYRGKRLLYFESEYRRDISGNGLLGFVLFANIHTVSEYLDNDFTYWHPAAGTGLRIKFNKISRTNIALDFAMSKDFAGIYLGLGEAF